MNSVSHNTESVGDKKVTLSSFVKKNVKHGTIYGIGDILRKTVGFLLLPIYTRYLTPADYGVLELLSVTISVLGLFVIHGMYSAFSRSYLYDYKGDYEQQRELLSTTYFYLFASGVFFFILFVLSRDFINDFLFRDTNHVVLLTLAFGICALQAIRGFAFSLFRNNFESVKFVLLRTVGFIVNISLNIYFVVIKELGVVGILIGNLLTTAVISILGAWLIRRYFVLRFSFAKLKPMLKFGLPLVPTGMAWFVFDISDRYFLEHLSSQTELGLYSLAAKFAMIVQFLLVMPLQRVYFASYYPLAKEQPENAKRILGRFFTYFCLVAGFVGLGVALLSEPLIEIMAAQSFWPSSSVVPFLVWSTVLLGLIHTLNAGINITGKTKYLPFIVGPVALVNIALNMALIPKYGMMGAGGATFLSYIIYFIISFIVNQRIYEREIETARLTKIVVSTVLIFLAGFLCQSNSLIVKIVYDVGALLLYPVLLFVFGFFTVDEKKKLKDFVIKKLRLRFV